MKHRRETTETRGPRSDSRSPSLFQSLVLTEPVHHPERSATTVFASVLAHSLLFLAMVMVPIAYYDEIPEQQALRAFFVPPLEIQAAPPPPPPPPAGARRVVKAPRPVAAPEAGAFIAPVEVPTELEPDVVGLDLGVPGGVAGGVEGGVPGGVMGGVVGGLPLTDVPPPPAQAPVRVGGSVKRPVKITHVAPVYPELAAQARIQGVVIVECILSPNGRVTDVKVLRGVPLLNQAAVEAVKRWVYTPTLLNGVPVPVLLTVTVSFDLS